MIRITGISLYLDYKDSVLPNVAAKKLGIKPDAITNVTIYKRSVDARKKEDIHFIATLDVTLKAHEELIVNRSMSSGITLVSPYIYTPPKRKRLSHSPVVVGAGPAGLFAALILAQSGARPVVIERGKDVDNRANDVREFWKTGVLNTNSNVQFGEGGAGTFSDGKLNTGTKDNRAKKVLQEFVKAGAPSEILYNAKPHIGTDMLPIVVKNIRTQIINLGGQFLFDATLTDFNIQDDKITSVTVLHKNKEKTIETDNVILAIGHSARDTFEMLYNKKILLEQKAFSIGARIEHLQSTVDIAQYGASAGKGKIGAADYKLAVHLKNGRGVYTFCMCPGGTVVAAASEEDMLVTNGMSRFARNEKNANSALLVGVNPNDFGSGHVLAGIELQRNIERKAFAAGGGSYKAPVQRADDFIANRKTTSLGNIQPSYTAGVTYSNLHNVLPRFVSESMAQGLIQMDNQLKGFANRNAVLTGVETRSSSPVRILRTNELEAIGIKGLYPCGEGAGYAGGIISAAVDGIKCAEAILK
ncbi:oxidoreductase [Clostridia bacterium]|nr:oxidoreductase [Clostridia bacterium]